MGNLGELWGNLGILGEPWGTLGNLGEPWGTLGNLGETWGTLGNLGEPLGTFGNPWDIATNATEEVKGKKERKIKKQSKCSFFTKWEEMSRVGSRDRHA